MAFRRWTGSRRSGRELSSEMCLIATTVDPDLDTGCGGWGRSGVYLIL